MSLRNSTNLFDSITYTISMGEDTDTTGAVAGPHHEEESIPRW